MSRLVRAENMSEKLARIAAVKGIQLHRMQAFCGWYLPLLVILGKSTKSRQLKFYI